MAYYNIEKRDYYIEYSIYDDKVIFVHRFGIRDGYRGQRRSYAVFNELKQYGMPIVLECFYTLEEFYQKLGFKKSCVGREGYLEMVCHPLA